MRRERRERTILLTAFDRFGPYPSNVSAELLDRLHGTIVETTAGVRLRVMGVRLPIRFSKFRRDLGEAIRSFAPMVAVGMGMDFKDSRDLQMELQASHNPLYVRGFLDDEEMEGPLEPLDDLSPVLRLPNEEEVCQLIERTRGIQTSEDAGRHMCETVLRDLIRESQNGHRFQPGFIHLPHTKALLVPSKQLEVHEKSRGLNSQEGIVRTTLAGLAGIWLEKRK